MTSPEPSLQATPDKLRVDRRTRAVYLTCDMPQRLRKEIAASKPSAHCAEFDDEVPTDGTKVDPRYL